MYIISTRHILLQLAECYELNEHTAVRLVHNHLSHLWCTSLFGVVPPPVNGSMDLSEIV